MLGRSQRVTEVSLHHNHSKLGGEVKEKEEVRGEEREEDSKSNIERF